MNGTETSRSILGVMRKYDDTPRDIFLFDLERGVGMRKDNYILLCNIKDGTAYASNFSIKEIEFKTPNVVMVFSTVYPNIRALSEDKWLILEINKDMERVDITTEELGGKTVEK